MPVAVMMNIESALELSFEQTVAALLKSLAPHEQLTLELLGEQSQFVRFNRGRVRQTGQVTDGQLHMTLMADQRNSFREIPFTGDQIDLAQAEAALAELRAEVPQLPIDPYMVLPNGTATSRAVNFGHLLSAEAVVDAILPTVDGLDFTGIYAAGSLIRAYADSAGQKHWFSTETFSLDYSLFSQDDRAVKQTFAGSDWDQAAYLVKLDASKAQLKQLSRPTKAVPKGYYRTYLAPAATAELITALTWGALSEEALQQGDSALLLLRCGEKQLSPQFTLKENFSRGLIPRFNNLGEVAPMELPLIAAGRLVNTLVSSRTAKEYNAVANGASREEMLRSPEVEPGTLAAAEVLSALDTGLYVSNLHYLNWSDRPTGRITGMTRYACFWVEQGEIVAPIENLRFDESLYRYFGDKLVSLTDFQEFIPNVETYNNRELGGIWSPGLLVDDFTYTL
jgi:predicted Zn-dependent protease